MVSDKEFFNNMLRALTALCAAQTESGKCIPMTMEPYDVVFTIMFEQEKTKQKQIEIIESEDFKGLYNEFVKGVKEGINTKRQ